MWITIVCIRWASNALPLMARSMFPPPILVYNVAISRGRYLVLRRVPGQTLDQRILLSHSLEFPSSLILDLLPPRTRRGRLLHYVCWRDSLRICFRLWLLMARNSLCFASFLCQGQNPAFLQYVREKSLKVPLGRERKMESFLLVNFVLSHAVMQSLNAVMVCRICRWRRWAPRFIWCEIVNPLMGSNLWHMTRTKNAFWFSTKIRWAIRTHSFRPLWI